jgi:tRNA(Ile)-lysidine synthase
MRGARPGAALDVEVARVLDLPRGSGVVVACSGGPDSVALAALLARWAPTREVRLTIAHVNHGLRASAWQDECVVLSAGVRLGMPVRIAALAPGVDDEASLRDARYAALAGIARDVGAVAVATAHTAEDQTETVLLALFRGTGLDGLAGIPVQRPLEPGITLVRPLLRIPRAELIAEVRRTGLPVAYDPTNAEQRYRRNAVRAALRELRASFPGLDRAVARCAEIVRDDLDDVPIARRRRALRTVLAERRQDIPFERIEALLRARPSARVFLKAGFEAVAGELDSDARPDD